MANIQPRIAYDNLLLTGAPTIVASSEPDPTNFPYEFAYDWNSYTHWLPSSGTQYLTATFAAPVSANYFAMYATTLATNAGQIALQYSADNVAWSDAVALFSPTGTQPHYKTFAAISARYWRVKVVSATASLIGAVAFGVDLTLPYGDWVGFSRPIFARDNEITNTTSQRGAFLGRSIIRQGSLCEMNLDFFTPTFMRDSWLPFMRHAEQYPFFLLDNPGTYPSDAAFCRTEGDMDKPKQTRARYMGTALRFRAKVY